MPDENQNQEENFVKRPVETPILDESLRTRFSESEPEPKGFKGFYQENKIYFWAILLGVIIIGVLAYFAFRSGPQAAPKDANISITTDVPANIASGGEAVYKVTVQNNDSQKLTKIQLELAYPDGVTYVSSVPNAENLSGTSFPVPDLIPGQNAAIFIKAKVNGSVNDEKTLNIKLHYQYSNFSSEFIKDSSVTVKLIASDVAIDISGPTTTNNAQLVVYTIFYQNNSDKEIKNGRVKMIYPEGFTFSSSQPIPDLSNDSWNVPTLAPNASSTITIQGTFNSTQPGQSRTLSADFLILGSDGSFSVQNNDSINTAISSLPLLVTQEVSPSSGGIIEPGDSLIFNVDYQNNGNVAASGVNIQVDLNSKVIDQTSIRAEGGQINNNTITWNASGVPKLASLSPNEKGQVTFRLKVNNPAVKDSSKNLNLISSVKIKSNEYSTPFPGNELNLKVSSPASVVGGLAFVSGQLPPTVGQSTTYKVTLSLTNSSNDFASGILTAFIPLGSGGFDMASVNSTETKNVQYDSSTGKLTWNFGGLIANTGRFSQARTLSFNITLNPSSSQVNQQVTLVKDINFSATDIYTQGQVKGNTKNITTQDLQGQNGYGNGTVKDN